MANNKLLASDNFASGSLAGGWSALPGRTLCNVVVGAPNVTEPAAINLESGQIWTGLSWPSDQTSEFTVYSQSSIDDIAVLYVRQQPAVSSCYRLFISNGAATLYRQDTGSDTQLATASVTIAAGDVWALQVAGAVLTAYQNGALILRWMDTTYTSGTPGYGQYSGAVAVSTSQISSWRGYSAVQQDGIWQKQGVVIPAASGDISSGAGGQASATMLFEGNAQILSGTVYKMWFSAGSPGAESNVYYAESSDGVSWTRHATTVLASFGSPFVIKNGLTYYMYVQPAASQGHGNFALYTSSDGIIWNLINANVFGLGTAGQWDDTIIWYFQPFAIIAGTWYALYSGGHDATTYRLSVGLATSTDGITWTRSASNPVIASSPAGGSIVNSGAIVQVGNTWYAWMFANQPNQQSTAVPYLDPGEGLRLQTQDFVTWTNPIHSVHQSQMYEGLHYKFGQSYPNGIFDIDGKAHLFIQSAVSDNQIPQEYQLSLAIAPAPIAAIVTQPEDATVQVASDAFTSGAGDLSPNWTTPPGFTKFQIVAGDLVEASQTNTVCGMYYSGASFASNQYSEITIKTLTATIIEPAVRMQSNSDCYNLNIYGSSGTLLSVNINKYIGGTSTQIGPSVGMTVSVGDVLRLAVVQGDDGHPIISFYQNGFLLLQVEDYSDALSGGAPAFLIYTNILSNAQVSAWAGGNTGIIPAYPSVGNSGTGGLVFPPTPQFNARMALWFMRERARRRLGQSRE